MHDAEPTEIEAGAPEYLPAPQAMQVEAPTSGKFGKYLPACRVREPAVACVTARYSRTQCAREEITVSAVDGLSRANLRGRHEDGQAHDRPCASPIHPPPRIGTSLSSSAAPPFSPERHTSRAPRTLQVFAPRFFTKKIEVCCDR